MQCNWCITNISCRLAVASCITSNHKHQSECWRWWAKTNNTLKDKWCGYLFSDFPVLLSFITFISYQTDSQDPVKEKALNTDQTMSHHYPGKLGPVHHWYAWYAHLSSIHKFLLMCLCIFFGFLSIIAFLENRQQADTQRALVRTLPVTSFASDLTYSSGLNVVSIAAQETRDKIRRQIHSAGTSYHCSAFNFPKPAGNLWSRKLDLSQLFRFWSFTWQIYDMIFCVSSSVYHMLSLPGSYGGYKYSTVHGLSFARLPCGSFAPSFLRIDMDRYICWFSNQLNLFLYNMKHNIDGVTQWCSV